MLSIIVPTFNAPDYLKQAIESVLAQTSGDWEIILCPDDGQDYSYIAQLDSRIRLVASDLIASGPTCARNRGLDYVTGTAIASLDDDDRLSRTYVESALAALETRSAILFPTQCIGSNGLIRTIGATPTMTIAQFSKELGSLHAVARTECFRPWRDAFAEDVIHTCEMIDQNGGAIDVVLTADYILNVRAGSVTTILTDIDNEYEKIINSNFDTMSVSGQQAMQELFQYRQHINLQYKQTGQTVDYYTFVKENYLCEY